MGADELCCCERAGADLRARVDRTADCAVVAVLQFTDRWWNEHHCTFEVLGAVASHRAIVRELAPAAVLLL